MAKSLSTKTTWLRARHDSRRKLQKMPTCSETTGEWRCGCQHPAGCGMLYKPFGKKREKNNLVYKPFDRPRPSLRKFLGNLGVDMAVSGVMQEVSSAMSERLNIMTWNPPARPPALASPER